MRYTATVTLCVFVASIASSWQSGDSETLPASSDVSLIIVGFRHGYRNPAQFLKNDTGRNQTGWGWEGPSQLTNIGKRQAYSLGRFLRTRYSALLPLNFMPSQVKAISSSAERCQMTLMSVMAGVFPPRSRGVWNNQLLWQPIAFEINDPLLRMYNVKCPTYTTVYQPISDDNLQESKTWLDNEKALIQYIVANTGLNGSLSDMADVADNIQSMIYNNAPMPDWIENPTLTDHTKASLIKEILEYAEAHQIQCAVDKPCAKSMAGLWMDQIVSILNKKEKGKLDDKRAFFYAAHTETVLSLMKLMEMNVSETPTSAGVIVEFRSTPPSVRTIFHEPHHNNPDVRLAHVVPLPYCENQEWCPLETFVHNVADDSFADWQEFCGLPKCAV